MNSLYSAPVSLVLDELFAASEMTKASFVDEVGRLTPDERSRLMASTDPLTLYGRAEQVHLAVTRATGTLLYMMARSSRARTIVEFGASFGVSTLHLAAALKDNGGGIIISSEFLPSKVAQARQNLAKAGLSEFAEIRAGDALETLARDMPDTIDLLFLDGAKQLYLKLMEMLHPRLARGGIVIADNVRGSPDYLEYVRAGEAYASLQLAGDVEMSVKL